MNSRPVFPDTHWTRLEREGGTAEGMEWFCETYRPAVLKYLQGMFEHHEAEDLCQEFFVKIVLGRDIPRRAEQSRGSLRALLHTALRRFLSNHQRGLRARKRSVLSASVALDAAPSTAPCFLDERTVPPDRAFDQAWAALLLERVVAAAEERWAARRRQALFAQLRPALDGSGLSRPHAEIAAELGLTVREVTYGLSRLRQLAGKLLLEEITRTVAGTRDVEEEWTAVRQALEQR